MTGKEEEIWIISIEQYAVYAVYVYDMCVNVYTLTNAMLVNSSVKLSALFAAKGVTAMTISYSNTPADHTSVALSWPRLKIISGDK